MPTSLYSTHSPSVSEVKPFKETKVPKKSHLVNMSRVCSVILGGGEGSRLFPLTQSRCKPAVLFGGRYCLIDVPVSNSLNSSISTNFIVTQFRSTSLHRHILQTYRPDMFANRCLEILACEQKPGQSTWFKGTADAIRQNLEYLLETHAEYFLILSGDQLYRMDFEPLVAYAMEKDVDTVVAALTIDKKSASRMGIMKVDDNFNITDFYEKPTSDFILERFKTPSHTLESMGHSPVNEQQYLGSMGIYLFKRKALERLLHDDPREDFGKHLIPTKVSQGSIACYPYNGYWEDIGTIESFYRANIALCQRDPLFNFYEENCPIYTHRLHLPGPKIFSTMIENAIICEGAVVEAKTIQNSILGHRSFVNKGTSIINSYLMGNDFYTSDTRHKQSVGIGENCLIKNAIIDKNVHIGKNVQLINKDNLQDYDGLNVYIRDGIIVVPKDASLPDNFVL